MGDERNNFLVGMAIYKMIRSLNGSACVQCILCLPAVFTGKVR